MSSPDPLFTVVVATHNRGRHILPTIRSVLAQTLQDFELLVVGDCCTDDTGAVLAPFLSDRLRWINLADRWHTQSGPNNHGIQEARGRYIAYLGHDDLWEPDHLACHAARYAQDAPDCVVSGIVMHQGRSGGVDRVLGLFDDVEGDRIIATHFVPPSGLSHSRAIARKAGPWKAKYATDFPVDSEFEKRLVATGARFLSTGRIGVHKFVSSVRYLSYLVPDADEQEAMWARITRQRADGTHEAWCAAKVAQARAAGRFMDGVQTTDASIGTRAKAFSDSSRGHVLPPLHDLSAGPVCVGQTPESRGADWHGLNKSMGGMRWTGPSDRPKLLIPVTGACEADLCIELRLHEAMPPGAVQFAWNGDPVRARIVPVAGAGAVGPTHHILLRGALFPDRPSVLALHYPRDMMHRQPKTPILLRGVALGRIMARCAKPGSVQQTDVPWTV